MARWSFLSALFLCLAIAQVQEAKAEVRITEGEGRLRIEVGGEHFADYVYQGYSRPFLFPLRGPGGVGITRQWPIADAAPGEEKDHPHHKSFWWAHGDMNGIDFW